MHLLGWILVSSLRIAKGLRTRLTDTWTKAQFDTIMLFTVCLATEVMFPIFCRGVARVECRYGDLLCTPKNTRRTARYFHRAKTYM
jgi:hypothetical protein